jgi:hypothetical protein
MWRVANFAVVKKLALPIFQSLLEPGVCLLPGLQPKTQLFELLLLLFVVKAGLRKS